MKNKETFEELAEKHSINEFPLKKFKGTQWNNQRENCKGDFLAGVKTGAKWQQEQNKNLYSEEDLKEAFRQGENNVEYHSKYGCYVFNLTEKEWLEQFKKK